MGKASVLITLVPGISAAVVFPDLLGLGDHHQLPADQILTNEFECTTAFSADALGFRQIVDDLLYRKILCQLVNGALLLPSVSLDGEGRLGGSSALWSWQSSASLKKFIGSSFRS